jgi:hypothetical protein
LLGENRVRENEQKGAAPVGAAPRIVQVMEPTTPSSR